MNYVSSPPVVEQLPTAEEVDRFCDLCKAVGSRLSDATFPSVLGVPSSLRRMLQEASQRLGFTVPPFVVEGESDAPIRRWQASAVECRLVLNDPVTGSRETRFLGMFLAKDEAVERSGVEVMERHVVQVGFTPEGLGGAAEDARNVLNEWVSFVRSSLYRPVLRNGIGAGGNVQPGEKLGSTSHQKMAGDTLSDFVQTVEGALLDTTSWEILRIMCDDISADEKMRKITEIDARYYGKLSPFWAKQLKVSEPAIRKTNFWKIDRVRHIDEAFDRFRDSNPDATKEEFVGQLTGKTGQ